MAMRATFVGFRPSPFFEWYKKEESLRGPGVTLEKRWWALIPEAIFQDTLGQWPGSQLSWHTGLDQICSDKIGKDDVTENSRFIFEMGVSQTFMCLEIPQDLANTPVLIQKVWSGLCESAFLTPRYCSCCWPVGLTLHMKRAEWLLASDTTLVQNEMCSWNLCANQMPF